jgi:hypothetical protein
MTHSLLNKKARGCVSHLMFWLCSFLEKALELRSQMIVPTVLLLATSILALVPPIPESTPYKGIVTACGSYFDSSTDTTVNLDQPCTGDNTKASWDLGRFKSDGTIILCGVETRGSDGVKVTHADCIPKSYAEGNFDFRPVDEFYTRVDRTLCESYRFLSGQHVSNVALQQVCRNLL